MVVGDAVDREDRADGDVDVDVARPVEGVEEHDVLPLAVVEQQRDRLGVLLGPDEAHLPAAAQRADELLVGQEVELLLDLALDVDVAGVAEQVHEPGLPHVAVDDLGRDGDVAEEPGELALRAGALGLALDDELLQRLEGAAARGQRVASALGRGAVRWRVRGRGWCRGLHASEGLPEGAETYAPTTPPSVSVRSMSAVRAPTSAPWRHSPTSLASAAPSSTS